MIGIRRRCASRTAIASVFRSMTNTASGTRCMFLTPPRLARSFSRSACAAIRSRVGSSCELSLGLVALEVVQALDPLRDRLEVGQQPTQPAVVDVWHVGRFRRVLDRVAGLLLGPDEQHGPAPVGDVAGEAACVVEQLLRLQQVDDVDAVPLAVDEAAHLGVPAACLVAEVNTGLQQLLESDLSHGPAPFVGSDGCYGPLARVSRTSDVFRGRAAIRTDGIGEIVLLSLRKFLRRPAFLFPASRRPAPYPGDGRERTGPPFPYLR